jgi:hypothetical protein
MGRNGKSYIGEPEDNPLGLQSPLSLVWYQIDEVVIM